MICGLLVLLRLLDVVNVGLLSLVESKALPSSVCAADLMDNDSPACCWRVGGGRSRMHGACLDRDGGRTRNVF
eukprot:764462-Hanusia_phi.AAC.1